MFETVGTATSSTSQIVAILSVGLNLLVSGSLSFVWALVNALQIIAHLPLFAVNMPGNSMAFHAKVAEFINFEALNPDAILTTIFDFSPDTDEDEESVDVEEGQRRLDEDKADKKENTWVLPERFETLTYGSMNTVSNLGSLFIITVVFCIFLICYFSLHCLFRTFFQSYPFAWRQ